MKILYKIRVLWGDTVYENEAETVFIGDGVIVEWIDCKERDAEGRNVVNITVRGQPKNMYVDIDGEMWIEE